MIDILIPTYNRSQELAKNLKLLTAEIEKFELYKHIKIIISNNASKDDTKEVVESFSKANISIKIAYFEQDTNIGLEKNAVSVLSKATAEYIMFLGDDDFLAEGYLIFCVQSIKKDKSLGFIISGLSSIFKDGNISVGRRESFKTKELAKGYETLLTYSHLGHQMSGILMKRTSLLNQYLLIKMDRNIYLFIYLLSNRMCHYNGIYAPIYKTKISVDNTKDWGYNEIGLLDEVFKSYYPFTDLLGEAKVASLMTAFIRMHPYRIDWSKGLIENYKSIILKANPIKTFKTKLKVLLLKEYILKAKSSN